MSRLLTPGIIEDVSGILGNCEGNGCREEELLNLVYSGGDSYRGAMQEACLVVGKELGALSVLDNGEVSYSDEWLSRRAAGFEEFELERQTLEILIKNSRSVILDQHLSQGPTYAKRNRKVATIKIFECLKSASLFIEDSSSMAWWGQWGEEDSITLAEYDNENRLEVGLKGEQATILHEKYKKKAIKVMHPSGVRRKMNVGYDVASRCPPDSSILKCIEVKTSSLSINSAKFHISRNQWEKGLKTSQRFDCEFFFYFWLWDKECRVLRMMGMSSMSEMQQMDIVKDGADASWEVLAIQAKELFGEGKEICSISEDEIDQIRNWKIILEKSE